MSFKVRRQIGEREELLSEWQTFAEAQEWLFRYVAEGGDFEFLVISEAPYDPKNPVS